MIKKEFGYIYFMSNEYNTTLYIGVTSDLKRRIYEHRNKICEGFTKKYNLTKFLYYEKYNSIVDAIKREKQIKNFKREWKLDLIKQRNPKLIDLYDWIMDNNNLNIHTEIIEEKELIYEVPNCAIADQVRNDVSKLTNNQLVVVTQPLRNDLINKQIKIQCPAKINLTLKVTGKREDGFHNIDSIMQTISLFDYLTITVEKSDKTEIILDGTSSEIPYNEKNLVYKAAVLFLETYFNTPLPLGEGRISTQGTSVRNSGEGFTLKVFIEKNIPVAAGLAGGSTDAAGTLYGLNKLFGEPLSREKLHELCAQLGSDLNLCLEGGKQRTTGRGEILEPMDFEEFDVSLIKPINLGISAKEAYTKFSEKIKNGIKTSYSNDLEWAVIDDYKELQEIKQKYPDAIMSGSGSTYFGIGINFEEQECFWVKNGLKSTPYGVKEV